MPETLEELNARIDLVELRVVRRDMEFRQHALSLKTRGRTVLSLSHWLRPVLGVGSGWLFWKLFRRRPHRHTTGDRTERHEGVAGVAGAAGAGLFSGLLGTLLGAVSSSSLASGPPAGHAAPGAAHAPAGAAQPGHEPAHGGSKSKPEVALLQMLTMAWGFMPARLRGSLGPETTQLLLGVVAGLAHGLQRRRKEGQD